MRVLVCGDRNWTDETTIRNALWDVTPDREGNVLIHGDCRGADRISEKVKPYHYNQVHRYPADWATFGKAAGPMRNMKMLLEGKPDIVLAFHDNIEKSKGTRNMVNLAGKHGVPVRIIESKERTD